MRGSIDEHSAREDSRVAHGVAGRGQRQRGPGRTSGMVRSRGGVGGEASELCPRAARAGDLDVRQLVLMSGKRFVFAHADGSQSAFRENAEDLADAEELHRALKKKVQS